MDSRLIIALDKMSEKEAIELIKEVSSECEEFMEKIIFKVNDLLADIGLRGLKKLIDENGLEGVRFMLDPKWHDIPNTLENYVSKLHTTGMDKFSDYVTIHASNGYEGCRAVVDKKKELGIDTKVLAVTALTSLEEQGVQSVFDETAKHAVLKLAGEALGAGVDGIVCSPLEVEVLREVYGENFVLVNPGVRFEGGETHDQKRTLTPDLTIKNGSTDVVMGRPILEAKDTGQAIRRFSEETKESRYSGSNGNLGFEKVLYTGDWKEILSYIGAFYFRPEGGKYCRLASGLLSNAYINIGTMERNYLVVEKAAVELASQIREQKIEADVVMGAQMGSVRSSLYLAEKMGIEESVYTEKSGDDNELMELKRHDIDLTGKRVIISEDIVTKGSTLKKMKAMVEAAGGTVVAIACVGNRHGKSEFEGTPLISCYTPEPFELYWDESTPEDQIKDFPRIPEGAEISEKPKNQWGELVESMRK